MNIVLSDPVHIAHETPRLRDQLALRFIHDVRDVPLLREDAKDAADIFRQQAETVTGLVTTGFTPESSVTATAAQDISALVYDDRFISVQLQSLANAKEAVSQPDDAESTAEDAQEPAEEPSVNGSKPKVGAANGSKS